MTSLHAILASALAALDADSPDKAANLCRQVLRQTPDQVDALQIFAAALERQGDARSAARLRRQAVAATSIRDGDILQGMGRRGDARAMYDGALQVDTYNVGACHRLGRLYQVGSEPVPPQFGKPPLAIYRTPLGVYHLPSDAPNDAVILRMKAGKLFEEEVVEGIREFIRPGSSVVDVGANFGQMTLLFADMVGPQGSVLSLEADDFIFHVLQRNIAANGKANVRAVNAAVYDRCGQTVFYPKQDFVRFSAYGSYGIDPNATEGRAVETVTVDSLQPAAPVSLIKVDIQGCDLFAMRGARETIARDKPAVIFEFEEQFQKDFGTCFQDYLDFIDAIGYRIAATINEINYLVLPRQ